MKKVVRLTESDLRRVVKRIINENEAKEMADDAMLNSAKADRGIKNKIINCINDGSYTHLKVLTTGVGTTALNALAVLLGGPLVAKGPALIILAGASIIATIKSIKGKAATAKGMMTTSDSGRGSVKDELKQLYNCLKGKGVMQL